MIVDVLSAFHRGIGPIVVEHDGILERFTGDGLMIYFDGAPLAEQARRAVRMAVRMRDLVADLASGWRQCGHHLDLGIGINTGPMIAGNIGSEAIMSYTVIGDAVNLGSRLESLNKEYGTRIIISDATRSQLNARYDLRPLGEVIVKGKSQAVGIFEVVGRRDRAIGIGAAAATRH